MRLYGASVQLGPKSSHGAAHHRPLFRSFVEAERLAYLKKHKRVSEYDSENLIFGLIEDVLGDRKEALGVIAHQPLYQLIRDYSKLSAEEECFIKTGLSYLDFLVYNKVTKNLYCQLKSMDIGITGKVLNRAAEKCDSFSLQP